MIVWALCEWHNKCNGQEGAYEGELVVALYESEAEASAVLAQRGGYKYGFRKAMVIL